MTKKFVKIHSERGYGEEMFEVVDEFETNYLLKSENGKEFILYKFHTYQDRECKFKSAEMEL